MLRSKGWILSSLIALFCSLPDSLFSQQMKGKEHFKILGKDFNYNDSLLRVAVNNYAFLDAVRHDDERKIISVEGTDLKVELFSLKELGKYQDINQRRMALSKANIPKEDYIFSVTPKGKLKLIIH